MLRSLLTTIVLAVLAIVLVLVGVRFLALLVGANQDSELVQKVYDWSEFWVEPFFNVFDLENKSVEGGGTFEPASTISPAISWPSTRPGSPPGILPPRESTSW